MPGSAVIISRTGCASCSRCSTNSSSTIPSAAATSHQTAYQRAARMMRTSAGKAFDLDHEPAKLRDAYGRNRFGQGCLLARRLVERGVPFIEVSLGGNNGFGWDTH